MGTPTTRVEPSGSATFDPFEPGFATWPYDQYARLRDEDPVHWSELLCGWLLTSHHDVVAVLRDHTVSSSLDGAAPSPVVETLQARQASGSGVAMTLVLRDDPDHARIRKALQAPFTARSIGLLRQSIKERVERSITSLAEREEIELMAELAYPLPVSVFCEMLGIPEEEGPRFRTWTAAVAQILDFVVSDETYDRCMAQIAEMEDYLGEVAEEKRRQPCDDVLTELVQAEVDGERLDPDELVAQLVTLYVAGHEPTTALIGNGMAALLAHPDQLQLLQERPELVPEAVQELLRYDGPNQFLRRTLTEPMTIGGHALGAGEVLYLGVGAANHDPSQWGDDAGRLRVDRPDASQHVQFGGGIHHCLGAHLARTQAEVVFTALLTRLGRIELAGDVTWSGRMTLRSATSVPLRLHF